MAPRQELNRTHSEGLPPEPPLTGEERLQAKRRHEFRSDPGDVAIDPDVLAAIPGRDPEEIARTGRTVVAELRNETDREYARAHGLRSREEISLHQHVSVGGDPWRRERFTDRDGVESAEVIMRLNAADLDAFQDLCDLEWGGLTYREGFNRLLAIAGKSLDGKEGGR